MTKLKPIISVGIVTLVVIAVLGITIAGKRGRGNSTPAAYRQNVTPQQQFSGPSATTTTIFEQDGVSFEHFWPLDQLNQNLKADESEIIVHNRGNQAVEFSSVAMDYFIAGAQMPDYSGTWEKFPDDVSWEKIEYLNIGAQYYKGERLALEPGQKGKIHYHYQVQPSQSQNPDQKIKLNLAFMIAGKPYKLDQELVRKSPPRQAPEGEAEHNSGGAQQSNQGH